MLGKELWRLKRHLFFSWLFRIADGAEFFLDYISSDLVGMIATRHLHIADQCPEGTLNGSCIRLAELHSDAVDYPKTG